MKIHSVAELTQNIKALLEDNYPDVWVSGEISNFKAHHNGHFYFNLKDKSARLSAVMFRGNNQLLRFKPEEGMEVVCHGRVTVYAPYGNYQLMVNAMEPQGLGALQLAFEQLKKQLAKEGLFDESRKQALPRFPRCLGVVTSPSGAAVRDIIRVATRRYPGIKILVVPTAVQGEGAASQIAAAIERLNQLGTVDVIIAGRGGGSIEDLWAFNEEVVARAIAASEIPVISAVGHETDFTIADFVADLRAATPSAAAEEAVPSQEEWAYTVAQWRYRLARSMQQVLIRKTEQLTQWRQRLTSPGQRLEEWMLRLDELTMRAQRAVVHSLHYRYLHHERLMGSLKNLNPLTILDRGYAVVTPAGSSQPLTAARDTKSGDAIEIRLADGRLAAEVKRSLS